MSREGVEMIVTMSELRYLVFLGDEEAREVAENMDLLVWMLRERVRHLVDGM